MHSKEFRAALFAALALTTVATSLPASAQHNHAAHAHVTTPVPLPTPRWAADAALREGMGRIHAALEDLRAYERGNMDADTALAHVARIQQAAADIFAKCKLLPKQDAVLHGMLIPLLGAAQRFKSAPRNQRELATMRKAVADYPRYFNDPGWGVWSLTPDPGGKHPQRGRANPGAV